MSRPKKYTRVARGLYRDKNKMYCIRIMDAAGRMVHKALGTTDRKTAERVLNDERERVSAIKRGETVTEDITMAALFKNVIEYYRPRLRSVEVKEWAARLFLSIIGDKFVSQLTPADLQRFQTKLLLKRTQGPGTINNVCSAITGAIRWAGKGEKHLRAERVLSLCAAIERIPTDGGTPVKVPTDDELSDILRRCGAEYRLPFAIMASMGLRQRECWNLTWSDVNLQSKTLLVRKSKNHRSRLLTIPEAVYGVFASVPQGLPTTPVVTASRTSSRALESWRGRNAAELRRLGYGFTGHCFRHYFGTAGTGAGVPTRIMQAYGGWGTPQAMEPYINLTRDHLRPVTDAMNEKFSRILHPDCTQQDGKQAMPSV